MEDTEKLQKLEAIILEVDLKLSVLNSAFKYPEDSEISLCAVGHSIEEVYQVLQNVRGVF